ncbi:MAG: hypothetical protein Q9213_003274 [Squamulea squamosa]
MDPPRSQPNLLSLPNEILLRIIENELYHEDLENVALSCRTIFDLAQSARSKHLERKWRFSTVIVGDIHVYDEEDEYTASFKSHPISNLRDLLADDAAAVEYCQILKIGGVEVYGDQISVYRDIVSVIDSAAEISAELLPQLQQLTRKRPYRVYINGIHWNDPEPETDYALAFCIPFITLQNIQILELTNCTNFLYMIKPVLEEMQQTHHQLKEVRLIGNHAESDQHLELLSNFAKLPAVRKLYGLHVTGDRDRLLDFPYETCCYTIEEIHLECSGIDGYCFEKLLNSCTALKMLYYEDNRSGNELIEGGPRRTISGLRMNTCETLESLTLLDPSNIIADAEDSLYSAELCNFQVLKHVAIECSIFVHEDSGDAPLRLVDTLPTSLETLELYRPKTESFLNGMFLGLRNLRKERLPRLRSILIQSGIKINPAIRRDCEELGIRLGRVDALVRRCPHAE